jgi:hypothetical protein
MSKKYIIQSTKHGTKEVLIDEEDYDLVDGIKWAAPKNPTGHNKFYVTRHINSRYVTDPKTGKRKQKRDCQRLHREIIKRKLNFKEEDIKGKQVDHINGEPLDNRRENLRLVTSKENSWNKGPTKSNTSGYVGVNWHKRRQKWQAQAKFICEQTGRRKGKSLGYYNDKEEAARAYDRWVIHNRDEHAYTNFPREEYK